MGNARNYQLRKSRLVEDQLKSNSVTSINELKEKQHELSIQNSGGYHDHSKSLMKGSTEDFNLIDKRKEILQRKR